MTKFHGQARDRDVVPGHLLERLIERAKNADHEWISGDRRFVTPHTDSQHVVLRFPDRYPDSHPPSFYTEQWPAWAPVVEPAIDHVRDWYGSGHDGLAKIMLSRLRPHTTIPSHADSHPSSQVPHNVHVPLITDPQVRFVIDGTRYHLPTGHAYEINTLLEHSVVNESDLHRVHLIIEIYPLDAS